MHSGTRLSELIARGPLTGDHVLRVATALAKAVAAAHAEARAFGALAPATVFVSDAGAVHPLDAASMPISARREDDLIALGALLYALATGKMPFAATVGTPFAGEPPSPAEFNPRLPPGLVQVIRRGVHPDPAQRFASADEMVAALGEVRRAPGSLESLLPSEHVSSSSRVKPPPRPAPDERIDDDGGRDDADGEHDDADLEEQRRGLPGFPRR
ncbi:MAG: hypothetical protein PVJ49_06295 [Acidobacteriota bacterium]|jgi:serine/threonine-protein kinase